jgi:beta-glucosidase
MSLEEKVGQMLQPELRHVTPEDVKAFHLGSILNGGGTFPGGDKYSSAADWVTIVDSYYQASIDDSDGNVVIPLIWGTDAVHGNNNVVGATLFPHNIGLGAMRNPELVKKIAQVTAAEVAATGIDWIFSPTVATVRNDLWGRTYEGYSEDPEIVKIYAGMFVAGLQGEADSPELLDFAHVVATAKHFIGDGGTVRGIDRGDTLASEQELLDIHGQGYITAIEAGVQSVMVSFNTWQGQAVHGHQYLLTQVLKQRMGFDGLVLSDWNGHSFVAGCTTDSCPQAYNAGVDLLMAAEPDWKELYANTLEQARSGVIAKDRIDDAVRRILRVKFRAGLFEKAPAERPLAGRNELIGSQQHRGIARQAVRESLVLLKNKNNLLPLDRKLKVMVSGGTADNIGRQSGGWTLSWQGEGNSNKDFPGATSIFGGIEERVNGAGGFAFLSVDGSYPTKPDVAIVVFGEKPYAEGLGDITTLEYQAGDKRDLDLLKKLKAQGIPVVSVFISGRPLWVNAEINASDAFVAAWLPGSEGSGIAEVIFKSEAGEVEHDFVGRLSFSWPMDLSQTDLNRGDPNYQPLFPYGFGLTYNDKDTLADNLPETIPEKYRVKKPAVITAVATLPVDFERSDHLSFTGFDGGLATVVSNPQADAVNASAYVGSMQKFVGRAWGGSTLKLDGAVEFTGSRIFTMKVWSARPVPVLLKLEGLNVERTAMHSGMGVWQELSFDFTGETGSQVTAITLIFDIGTMGNAAVDETNWSFLFDDIALKPGTR